MSSWFMNNINMTGGRDSIELINGTNSSQEFELAEAELICRRESSLLFLLLMLGTVWVAVSLFNFNKT